MVANINSKRATQLPYNVVGHALWQTGRKIIHVTHSGLLGIHGVDHDVRFAVPIRHHLAWLLMNGCVELPGLLAIAIHAVRRGFGTVKERGLTLDGILLSKSIHTPLTPCRFPNPDRRPT